MGEGILQKQMSTSSSVPVQKKGKRYCTSVQNRFSPRTHPSVHRGWMGKSNAVQHTVEYYSAFKRKGILIHATWVECEDSMLSDTSQTQRTNALWLHSQRFLGSAVHTACRVEEERTGTVDGHRVSGGDDRNAWQWWWLYHAVTVFNATNCNL
jgi:hypothetical protein